jgi:hypothetical protein
MIHWTTHELGRRASCSHVVPGVRELRRRCRRSPARALDQSDFAAGTRATGPPRELADFAFLSVVPGSPSRAALGLVGLPASPSHTGHAMLTSAVICTPDWFRTLTS